MMTATLPPTVRDGLYRFRDLLRARFGDRLREVVLFGSRARGDAGADSDTDVLVVVDGLTPDEEVEVFDLAWQAEMEGPEWIGLRALAWSSDFVALMRARERRIARDIARDGVPL